MEGLNAQPFLGGALATALESGRAGFNDRLATARRSVPGFDAERFARRFALTARPAVDAVAAVAPDRVPHVTGVLFEVQIAMAERGSLGPTAGSLVDQAWTDVLPTAAPLVARSPDQIVRALTHAISNVALVSTARPREWIAHMRVAGPACATTEEWLACGLVAAWLAGAAHFRRSALVALSTLSADAARAVLNLPLSGSPLDLRNLVATLDADPWRLPTQAVSPATGRTLELVATVGGFRGFGGPFMVPPDVAVSDGRFVVFDGRGTWHLFADACGATFVRTDSANLDGESGAREGAGVGPGGRVVFRDHERTFPMLADVSSLAATATTLVVAVPRSHDVFVIALVTN